MVIEDFGRTLHIFAHSSGPAISLAFALNERADILSLSVLEPNPLWFLNQDGYSGSLQVIEIM